MCCYFDEIIKIEDFDHDNILRENKLYEKILVFNISYQILIVSKPLGISLDKIDGFIRVDDESRYLVLLGGETRFHLRQDQISHKIKKWHYIYNSS